MMQPAAPSEAKMGIRPATVADLDNISLLAQVVWVATYAREGITTAFSCYIRSTFSKESLLKELQTNQLVIAERENSLLGYALLNQSSGELITLYVLPQLQGHGVGSALVKYCQQLSDNVLWLTCWEGNTAALVFYQKLQFRGFGEDYFVLDTERYRNIKLTL
ncbi:MAG: GNAT family N-acetyltransferase [Idiomarina sp.]|nr:GNAT family N-acetyltransferase [Idiomarina sp.]